MFRLPPEIERYCLSFIPNLGVTQKSLSLVHLLPPLSDYRLFKMAARMEGIIYFFHSTENRYIIPERSKLAIIMRYMGEIEDGWFIICVENYGYLCLDSTGRFVREYSSD